MKKDIARKTYLKKRQEQVPATFEEESSKLVQNTIALIEKYKPKYIHCFLPIHSKGEINTTPIIQHCWKNDYPMRAQPEAHQIELGLGEPQCA